MRTFGQAESTKPLEPLILLILRFRDNFLLFFQNQVNKNNRLWPFIDDNYLKVLEMRIKR